MTNPKRIEADDKWRTASRVQCPICDAAPKWPCQENGATRPKGEEHGYRLAVAQEVALNNVLAASRKAAIDEAQTLLSRLAFEDFTAGEAVALVALVRPIHERACREQMQGRLRLVGDAK